jgi:hypothetical protein
MSEVKMLKIKNGHFSYLIKWISDTPIGNERRQIKKFSQSLGEPFQEFESERLRILNEFCDKNDKGEPEMEGSNFQFKNLDQEKRSEWEKQMTKLLNEEASIDILPSMLGGLALARTKLENLKVDLDPSSVEGVQADIAYEQIMDAFDAYDASA